jgi:TPR repeat protein
MQGEAFAQYNLGLLYGQGRGVMVRDEREALGWLRKSAAGGYPPAVEVLQRIESQQGAVNPPVRRTP